MAPIAACQSQPEGSRLTSVNAESAMTFAALAIGPPEATQKPDEHTNGHRTADK